MHDASHAPRWPERGHDATPPYRAERSCGETVMVIKRSMSPGFAGIDNPLYELEKTLMLFGDAKAFVHTIVHEINAAT